MSTVVGTIFAAPLTVAVGTDTAPDAIVIAVGEATALPPPPLVPVATGSGTSAVDVAVVAGVIFALAVNVGTRTTIVRPTEAGLELALPVTVGAGTASPVIVVIAIAAGNAVASPPTGGNTTMRVRAEIAAIASTR
jgi:hypothetical protein